MNPRLLYIYPQTFHNDDHGDIRVVQLTRTLRELGHAVDILTLPSQTPWPTNSYSTIYTTPWVPFGEFLSPTKRFSVRRLFATLWITLLAIKLALKTPYAAIHVNQDAMRLGKFLAKLTRAKLIIHWSFTPRATHQSCWNRPSCKCYLDAADLIIMEEPSTVSQIRQASFANRIAQWPLFPEIPSDLPPYTPQQSLGIYRDKTPIHVLAFCDTSDIYHLKGYLNALYILTNRHSQLRFTLMGNTPGPGYKLIKKLIQSQVNPVFTFVEKTNHPLQFELLANADMVLFQGSNNFKTPPLPLLNTLSAGRAIMTYASPCFTSILTPASACFVSDYEGSFIETFELMMYHPDLRKKLALAAKLKIESERPLKLYQHSLRGCYDYILNQE